MNSPLISVLMPVYNGEKYLAEAIESILNQTFSDFEFLIINDGSTDRTEEIVKSYDDNRIRYIKNKSNLKIVQTLNKGIELSRGKYIARMDADDISLPQRLELQVNFLEEHSHVGVCGSAIKVIGDIESTWVMPEKHEDIKFRLLFNSCLMHPSVMIRKEILVYTGIKYAEQFNKVEDYELWTRLVSVTELHNLQNVLLEYRIEGYQGFKKEYKSEQDKLSDKVRENYAERIKLSLTKDELSLHNQLLLNHTEVSFENALVLYNKIKKRGNDIFSQVSVENELAARSYFLYFASDNSKFKDLVALFRFFSGFESSSFRLVKAKLVIKSLLKWLR